MIKAIPECPIRPAHTHTRALPSGVSLEGRVSPCVFTNRGYPLQVQVTLKLPDGTPSGVAYAVNRSLTAESATDADVVRLLEGVSTRPCSRCSVPAFDATTIETNRGELCESCFLDDLHRECALVLEAELSQIKERDQQMKSQGMRFRITAWIHPDNGDDYQVDWYAQTAPAPDYIATHLRREGSTVVEDFEIIEL